jgi:hypothetical protein
MEKLLKNLQKIAKPQVAEKIVQIIESWQKTLTNLVPGSYVEVVEAFTTEASLLFTWFFENKLTNGAKQTGKVYFYADGSVEFFTQAGTHIENFNSFDSAEKYFMKYFGFTPDLPEIMELQKIQHLDLEKREQSLKDWLVLLKQFEKYHVEVEVRNGTCGDVFTLWLPSLEKVLTGEGEMGNEAVYFEPEKDWNKVLNEEVIIPLQKMYGFSNLEIQELPEAVKNLQVSEKADQLCKSLNEWVDWLKTIPSQIPFEFRIQDVYAFISQERWYFNGKEVHSDIRFNSKEKEYRGLVKADFEHRYSFNGNDVPIKIFNGSIIYFEENIAVLQFSGVPNLLMEKSIFGINREAKNVLYYDTNAFYAHAMANRPLNINENYIKVEDYVRFLKPLTFTGTWEEASFQLIQLLSFINAFLGKGIKECSVVS